MASFNSSCIHLFINMIVKLKILFISSLLCLIFSQVIMAADLSSLNVINESEIKTINSMIVSESKNIYKNRTCPLASKSLSTIIAKAKTIKELFKNNDCMAESNGVSQIVDSLNDISVASGSSNSSSSSSSNSSSSSSNITTSSVDPAQITSVFDNINNIFQNSGCALKQKGFLNFTADLVQSFSQMSLLIPSTNAIGITAASLATSSILRLISSWFEDTFDFEDSVADRENFIKLNCSYFDLRRSIDLTGVKDIFTQRHQKNLDLLSKMSIRLDRKQKELINNKQVLLDNIEKRKISYIQSKIGDFEKFKNYFSNFKKSLVNTSKVQQIAKLQQISFLDRNINLFKAIFDTYTSYPLNFQAIIAGNLDQLIDKISMTENLFSIGQQKFHDEIELPLLAHIDILLDDLSRHHLQVLNEFKKQILDDELMTNDSLMKLIVKTSKKQEDRLGQLINGIKPAILRLNQIKKNDRIFSSNDESTGQEVNLQSITEQISEQIYGKWGNKFLDVLLSIAIDENKKFEDLFDHFSNIHLISKDSKERSNEWKLNKEIGMVDLQLCEDAAPTRDSWKKAKNLVEYAYDFIVTNQTLFHKSTDSNQSKIKKHLKSAKIAKLVLKGESVSKMNKKYINQIGIQKKLLGAVMLKVEKNKKDSIIVQNLYEDKLCKQIENNN